MSPVLKIMAGALMMVLGIFASVTYANQLLNLVKGGIGPLLILVGAFIVWLESDEWKMQRDEKQERREQKTLQQEETTETSRDAKETAQEIKNAVSTGPDPEEVLSGTVQEVKDQVDSRDDLDIQELLEAEKNGDNRKTLVNYLERRV